MSGSLQNFVAGEALLSLPLEMENFRSLKKKKKRVNETKYLNIRWFLSFEVPEHKIFNQL